MWSSRRSDECAQVCVAVFYLVVFVGGVVLEKYDALTVQTPVVPFSLLRFDKNGMRRGTEAN